MSGIKVPADLKSTVKEWEFALFGGKEILAPLLKQTKKLTLGEYLTFHEESLKTNNRTPLFDSFKLNVTQTGWTVRKEQLKRVTNSSPKKVPAAKKKSHEFRRNLTSSAKSKTSKPKETSYTMRYRLAYQKQFAKRFKTEGFIQFGDNSDADIKALTRLNAIPIQLLENRLKPTPYLREKNLPVGRFFDTSDEGFLKRTDHLIDVLVRDNQIVHHAHLTHAELIEPIIDAYVTMLQDTNHKAVYKWSYNKQSLEFIKPASFGRDSQSNPFMSGQMEDMVNDWGLGLVRYTVDGARDTFFSQSPFSLFGVSSDIFVSLNANQSKLILAPETFPKPHLDPDNDWISLTEQKRYLEKEMERWHQKELIRKSLRERYEKVFRDPIWPFLRTLPIETIKEGIPISFWPEEIVTQLKHITDQWLKTNPTEAAAALAKIFLTDDRHLPLNLHYQPVFLVNKTRNQRINLHPLTMSLIWQFGFYQNGPYRVDPKQLLSIMGF